MPLSVVSVGIKNGVQKGPGTDASMLTQMKRRAVLVNEATQNTTGRKGMGAVVDSQKTRGFSDSGAIPVYVARGAVLGFLKY
jgi:hypothetical protein